MIKKAIHTANDMYKGSQPVKNSTVTEQPIFRSLPFIPDLSFRIQKQLKLMNPQLRAAPKTVIKQRNIYSSMKTRIPKMWRKGIVYRIKCKMCSTFYIGETKRCFCTRKREHEYDIKTKFVPGDKTALTRHCLENVSHEPDFSENQLKILDRESDWYKRKTLEACYIWLYGESAQNYKSCNKLHATYSNVMNSFKQLHTR
ncbi:hypothetical protein HA402_015554 [Bradysia odoriphaga]|nr:hypothetical protein HA402_015554 [Bradysia odoriphaga]